MIRVGYIQIYSLVICQVLSMCDLKAFTPHINVISCHAICYDCIYADYIRQWEMSHFKWYDVESLSPRDSILALI